MRFKITSFFKIKKNKGILFLCFNCSSAAYYISKLLPNVDITIYEKEPHVCGRVQDTIINGRNPD
jgi:hypothetical protein